MNAPFQPRTTRWVCSVGGTQGHRSYHPDRGTHRASDRCRSSYPGAGDVYFDVLSFGDYGKLSAIGSMTCIQGEGVGKRDPRDFTMEGRQTR